MLVVAPLVAGAFPFVGWERYFQVPVPNTVEAFEEAVAHLDPDASSPEPTSFVATTTPGIPFITAIQHNNVTVSDTTTPVHAALNSAVTLTAVPAMSDGGPVPLFVTYQWWERSETGTSDTRGFTRVSGATDRTFVVDTTTPGTMLYAVTAYNGSASDPNQNPSEFADNETFANVAYVQVLQNPEFSRGYRTSFSAPPNTDIEIVAVADNASGYQWWESSDVGLWTPIAGEITDTIVVNEPEDTIVYLVAVAENEVGAREASGIITVSVAQGAPVPSPAGRPEVAERPAGTRGGTTGGGSESAVQPVDDIEPVPAESSLDETADARPPLPTPDPEDDQGGIDPLWWYIGGGVLLALVAIAVTVTVVKKRGGKDGGPNNQAKSFADLQNASLGKKK
ncbi:MAG: hypothetical protein FWG78_01465 [Coriobacteriia bacterium]|nr:hypothetical protein [Coriobacteriia bacterium]